jgi:tight adherence protein C
MSSSGAFPTSLFLLIIVVVAAVTVAVIALLGEVRRRQALARAVGSAGDDSNWSVLIDVRPEGRRTPAERLIAVIGEKWETDPETASKLLQAGYEGTTAAVTYGVARIALVAFLPLIAFVFTPKDKLALVLLALGASGLIGLMLPTYWLTRAVRLRQERIRRSLPDAMDLLVLCVEAGLGFDAAVLRVAKEMRNSQPDLAGELLMVNRKVNAGVSREEALRMTFTRTGVEELRVFVQHMIQSERLGTSVAQVLRVYGATLRRQRKQRAEKKAATAPLKMTIPMTFLILPALFVVILGPALTQFGRLFHPTAP